MWIETSQSLQLKMMANVTPHVGVWIETRYWNTGIESIGVTPHVGVWIETCLARKSSLGLLCHTSCRCVD